MSIWYHFNVEAYGNREAIGKFFNLDPEEDIHYIDRFSFSFGQKNVPGMRLGKLIVNNPDLVFLVKNSVEDSTYISLERFNERLTIEISQRGVFTEVNKKLLEMYKKEFPTLIEKHLKLERGFKGFRWSYLIGSHEKISELLNNANDYRDMTSLFI